MLQNNQCIRIKMNDSFLNSANAPYVAELYFKYSQNPKSIDESWKTFFSSLNEDELSIISVKLIEKKLKENNA